MCAPAIFFGHTPAGAVSATAYLAAGSAFRVSRALWRPDHRYTLALDNGQVWEQVEEQQGVYVDTHDTVTISPGVLGAFFLETSKRKSFRVRRLQ